MDKRKLQSKPWYPGAVVACIAVVLYVALTRPGAVSEVVGRVIGYFLPLLLGCVIAYLVNPLARLYGRSVCRGIKKEKTRAGAANILAFVTVFLVVALLLLVSVPQLIESITDFAGSLRGYIQTVEGWDLLGRLGLEDSTLLSSTENLMQTVGTYLADNLANILNTTVGAGKGVVTFALGFLLSIYLLSEKSGLKSGLRRFLKALLGEARYGGFSVFLHHCDAILNRYIVFNILDCVIVGVVNAVFMLIARMPYVGLVSFVVAVTNLIPTFGPIIGAVIGAFLLVLVRPWYALIFIIFTLVLQAVDAYILKPRLFGNSLGVSGLWIMVGVVVGGRMFGIIGILVAIPGVAILDYTFRDWLMPWLERRRAERDREAAGTELRK